MENKPSLIPLLLLLALLSFPGNAEKDALAQNSSKYLLLLEDEKGDILYSVPLNEGGNFAIRFIHSVAKSPVTDHFIIKEGKIFLDKTIYHDFGAGLPHAPENGQTMKAENGEISITGFNRELPYLAIRVGRVADHTLILFESAKPEAVNAMAGEVPLDKLATPGTVIIFKIKEDKNKTPALNGKNRP